MPIYAYKCSACGFAKDTLQKMSDPPLTVCPECGQETFSKQVTAAGFQLKGSGWYVTDFRNNGSSGATGSAGKSGESTASAASGAKSEAAGDKGAAPAAASSGQTEGSSSSAGSTAAQPAATPKPASGSAPSA